MSLYFLAVFVPWVVVQGAVLHELLVVLAKLLCGLVQARVVSHDLVGVGVLPLRAAGHAGPSPDDNCHCTSSGHN